MTAQEYLATSFRPDCDFVDGVLLERNVGHKDHSNLQAEILAWFRERRRQLRLKAFPEQRIRVATNRYPVPDIWILSPDDSFPKLQSRLDDYLSMGVPNIWVVDPASRRGWTVTREAHFESLDGALRSKDGAVTMVLAELFLAE